MVSRPAATVVLAVCASCGYGVGVRRVALLEDGRIRWEFPLCSACRLRLDEAVERAAR